MGAVVIGFGVGMLCCWAVGLKARLKYDDSLDVVGVHGVGGLVGAILTGVFASVSANPEAVGPILHDKGRLGLIGIQLLVVGVVVVYSFCLSFGIMKLVGKFFGVRATKEEEDIGLDLALHGETGYNL